MRWLIVLGFVLALLPANVSAQAANCITTYIGGTAFTNCYTVPRSGPPPGYMENPNFTRKFTCRLNNFANPERCEPYAPEDFYYVPVPAPAAPPPAIAQPAAQNPPSTPPWLVGPCEFKLGFKALRDQIPEQVGDCGENEHWNTQNGDSVQQTKRGLLVWRRADNFTAFTDGYRTWVSGPIGVQQRLNTECFAWETGCR